MPGRFGGGGSGDWTPECHLTVHVCVRVLSLSASFLHLQRQARDAVKEGYGRGLLWPASIRSRVSSALNLTLLFMRYCTKAPSPSKFPASRVLCNQWSSRVQAVQQKRHRGASRIWRCDLKAMTCSAAREGLGEINSNHFEVAPGTRSATKLLLV